jgi:hypothetical protein
MRIADLGSRIAELEIQKTEDPSEIVLTQFHGASRGQRLTRH